MGRKEKKEVEANAYLTSRKKSRRKNKPEFDVVFKPVGDLKGMKFETWTPTNKMYQALFDLLPSDD